MKSVSEIVYDATAEHDELTELLRSQERSRARVVMAAQTTLWFFEAQNFDQAYQSLKVALDEHNEWARKIFEYRKRLSPKPNDNSRSAA